MNRSNGDQVQAINYSIKSANIWYNYNCIDNEHYIGYQLLSTTNRIYNYTLIKTDIRA